MKCEPEVQEFVFVTAACVVVCVCVCVIVCLCVWLCVYGVYQMISGGGLTKTTGIWRQRHCDFGHVNSLSLFPHFPFSYRLLVCKMTLPG